MKYKDKSFNVKDDDHLIKRNSRIKQLKRTSSGAASSTTSSKSHQNTDHLQSRQAPPKLLNKQHSNSSKERPASILRQSSRCSQISSSSHSRRRNIKNYEYKEKKDRMINVNITMSLSDINQYGMDSEGSSGVEDEKVLRLIKHIVSQKIEGTFSETSDSPTYHNVRFLDNGENLNDLPKRDQMKALISKMARSNSFKEALESKDELESSRDNSGERESSSRTLVEPEEKPDRKKTRKRVSRGRKVRNWILRHVKTHPRKLMNTIEDLENIQLKEDDIIPKNQNLPASHDITKVEKMDDKASVCIETIQRERKECKELLKIIEEKREIKRDDVTNVENKDQESNVCNKGFKEIKKFMGGSCNIWDTLENICNEK